jgi:hypothetical protein
LAKKRLLSKLTSGGEPHYRVAVKAEAISFHPIEFANHTSCGLGGLFGCKSRRSTRW